MPGRYQSSRGMRLRPVDSIKHIVEANGSIVGAAPSTIDVITAAATSALDVKAATNTVFRGSTVNAIYLRVEVVATVAAGGVDNLYMAIFKNPGNNLTIGNLDALGTSDIRKFVIHQEMIMTGQAGGNPGSANIPRTMFNGVVSIPRGYRRNGVSDRLQIVLQHRTGEATQRSNFCIECIYKEFR